MLLFSAVAKHVHASIHIQFNININIGTQTQNQSHLLANHFAQASAIESLQIIRFACEMIARSADSFSLFHLNACAAAAVVVKWALRSFGMRAPQAISEREFSHKTKPTRSSLSITYWYFVTNNSGQHNRTNLNV